MSGLQSVINEFANRLTALIDSQAMEQARATVLAAFGGPPRRGPGRPPKSSPLTRPARAAAGRRRKKPPVQLCPVPGCKNPAAPIFGMVCKTHKNLPKAQIKKFREARRAKKLGLKPNGVSKRSAPKARKPIRATKTRGRKAKALKPAAAANPTPAATSATGAAARRRRA